MVSVRCGFLWSRGRLVLTMGLIASTKGLGNWRFKASFLPSVWLFLLH
jgi:hypothetical protein